MKKLMLAGAVAGLASVSVAHAADLPNRRSAPIAPAFVAAPFTWTGFYIGLNAGYAFGDQGKSRFVGNPTVNNLVAGGFLPASYKTQDDGFTGGLQVGYNQQYGALVAGIEADINYVDGKKRTDAILGTAAFSTSSFAEGRLEYLGTVRGRLGFLPTERLLVYATGGLAFGGVKGSSQFTITAPGNLLNGASWAGSKSDTRTGYTVGGGVEYAFTQNLSAKVEYLYYDLGKKKYTLNPINAAAAGNFAVLEQETKGSLVRAGLNYRF